MTKDPGCKADLTEISSSEILNKIQEGESVVYDHVRIVGDLDLSKLNLPAEPADTEFYPELPVKCKIVSSLIQITNSEFMGTIYFSNCQFKADAVFRGASFSSDAYFRKATFELGADFLETTFQEGADFRRATFGLDAYFQETIFKEDADFIGAAFNRAYFIKALFKGNSDFTDTAFCDGAYFVETTFDEGARFREAEFREDADFIGTAFNRADFIEAKFKGKADFVETTFKRSADFSRAEFRQEADFGGAAFKGETLTFRGAFFSTPISQEDACRRAKNVLERNGNRDEAGYHLYREMEGKRKQKESNYRYFDFEALLFYNETNASNQGLTDLFTYLRSNIFEYLFIQVIFGYGVHPFRLWGCWWIVVGLFALLYWTRGGINSTTNQSLSFLDYLWFSITVAVTPGFAGYKPAPGFYQVLAGIEAIFGTFMWAAFITTFARKFSR